MDRGDRRARMGQKKKNRDEENGRVPDQARETADLAPARALSLAAVEQPRGEIFLQSIGMMKIFHEGTAANRVNRNVAENMEVNYSRIRMPTTLRGGRVAETNRRRDIVRRTPSGRTGR